MGLGIFAAKQSVALPLIARCSECQLFRKCKSPKMEISGSGKRKVLVIGEAPGRDEDMQGRAFVGESGKILQESLASIGINLRKDCWITNALICRPPRNRTPTNKEITFCRPNVVNAIRDLKPNVIVLLGGIAVKSVIGWLWREDPGGIFRWVGWRIPSHRLNAWICPTFHPSFLLRTEREKQGNPVARLYFDEHLKQAFKKSDKPYEEVPDYKKQVRLIYDAKKAALEVDKFVKRNRPTAWDIETDMLKPDRQDASIVSCSLSDGEITISFPWLNEAIESMREFVTSDVPKMGWNSKFESRWIQKKLGVRVRNWVWDGMLDAHVLDNRPKITSLKFQAFVQLGIEPWEHEVAPFLHTKGSNVKNRIREFPIEKLLLYGGLDALYEYKVGMMQAKKAGIEL